MTRCNISDLKEIPVSIWKYILSRKDVYLEKRPDTFYLSYGVVCTDMHLFRFMIFELYNSSVWN